ncbi:MAG: T9SS type A sorting domain-containing protein [Bacteroidetes bacterium]|nr:T9SS type A sorting domain-containing protein [Bacteroidota bacterium]
MSRTIRFVLTLIILSSCAAAQVGTLKSTLKLEVVSDVTIPYQNGMPVPSFEKQRRPMVNLAGEWKKARFAANHTLSLTMRDSAGYAQLISEAAGRHLPSYNDQAWTAKQLPAIENVLAANERMPEIYQDGVWYRRSFTVNDTLKEWAAALNFLAVNYIADVWLNGTYLGWHEGGYTPFAFDVSSALRFDSANVLVVRVDNIPWGTRKDIVPYVESDWFNYTGIIHDVFLEFSNRTAVSRADVIPKDVNGTLDVAVVLNNRYDIMEKVDVMVQVFSAKTDSLLLRSEYSADLAGSEVPLQGTAAGSLFVPADSAAVWKTTVTVANPKLWSPLKPNLYIMKVTVSQNGAVRDVYHTQFGIRTIKTSGDKILLNEKIVFLHGVARHEDHPQYGRSVPAEQIYTDLQLVKSVNANYLRTGHYPNHPFTYIAADRLGMIVMEEIPVWWFDEVFPWLIQNSVRQIHHQMFREMAFRDRNRPSIGLWSLANECRDVAGRSTFFQAMKIDLESQYWDGRLFTQSAAADRPGPWDESMSPLDVSGWTMYFGIFYDPYGFGKYKGTRNFLLDANDYHPNKPVIATEFGFWSGEEMNQFTKQTETFDSTFRAFEPRLPVYKDGRMNGTGFLAGVTWWTIFDWYRQNNGFQSMGLIRMKRDIAKPVFASAKAKYAQFVDKSEYITSVPEPAAVKLPTVYGLDQNFPNPFNPVTNISFRLPVSGRVNISVYDILGKNVRTLVDEERSAGEYTVPFDASSLASGIYFYKIRTGVYTATKKMTLLK